MRHIIIIDITGTLEGDNNILYENIGEVKKAFPNAEITSHMEKFDRCEPTCVGWVKSKYFTIENPDFVYVDDELDNYSTYDLED